MGDSSEELKREFDEFAQAEASLDSGLESAPRSGGVPPWVKWVVLGDLVIIAVVLLVVFAS